MYAYSEIYLEDAMKNLGEAFDYAVNACHISADEFWNLFVTGGFATYFGKGNPNVVSGKSGTELVMEILTKAGLAFLYPPPQIDYACSPEYWCGWVLAYAQWKTGCSFRDIHRTISGEEVLQLYPTLHEASEEKFVDTLNRRIERCNASTKLQQQRKRCGYSQKELAVKAGVNLRTLQQYEGKAKDINKASLQTVMAMAGVLGCGVEDLREYSG